MWYILLVLSKNGKSQLSKLLLGSLYSQNLGQFDSLPTHYKLQQGSHSPRAGAEHALALLTLLTRQSHLICHRPL